MLLFCVRLYILHRNATTGEAADRRIISRFVDFTDNRQKYEQNKEIVSIYRIWNLTGGITLRTVLHLHVLSYFYMANIGFNG